MCIFQISNDEVAVTSSAAQRAVDSWLLLPRIFQGFIYILIIIL